MQKYKALRKANLDTRELRLLQAYGLTDCLQQVSGIGPRTCEKIQAELSADSSIIRAADGYRWLYGLSLDVLDVAHNAALLRQRIGASGTSLLEEMQYIEPDDYRHFMESLDELPHKDRSILLAFARDGLSAIEISKKYQISPAEAYNTRKRTLARIRNTKSMSTALIDTVYRTDVRTLLPYLRR